MPAARVSRSPRIAPILILVLIAAAGLLSCGETETAPTDAAPPTTASPPAPLQAQWLAFQDGVSPDPGYAGTRDVPLAADLDPNVNLGGLDQLETFFAEQEYRRTLVRWDLSALPSGAAIQAAAVELYRYDGDP
ncbi:MAG: hypothetical protein JXA37_13700, partial [Chloroflexia bacterium]|nr:hypothetical protein [Chloroflexia bacterium]